MKKLGSILLASALLALTSCSSVQRPFIPFETNAGEKELVKTKREVAENAKRYHLPLYALRKNGELVSYYTEGVVTTNRENVGRVEFGYECTDNFWLFDDDIYNGVRIFNPSYSVERIDQ
ncbi:Uncharacterised protein [uncultured archaeon]|nr:Uncharacterised protein [uncultured archaeon]